MKYAWIENNKIRDIAHGNPVEIYHPDVAAHYTEQVPDDAENGDSWGGEVLTKPAAPEPVEPATPIPPKVSPVQFKLLFMAQERIAIAQARVTDPVLQDLCGILDDPRLTEVDMALKSTQETLDYLTEQNLIGAGRKAEILTGELR